MVHRCLAAISGSALARGLRGSGRRFDGRAPLESRPLEGSVAVLPFVHGSSLVSLGHTQVLVIFLFFYLFYFKFFWAHSGALDRCCWRRIHACILLLIWRTLSCWRPLGLRTTCLLLLIWHACILLLIWHACILLLIYRLCHLLVGQHVSSSSCGMHVSSSSYVIWRTLRCWRPLLLDPRTWEWCGTDTWSVSSSLRPE